MRNRPDVISHSVTQELKMRDSLKRGIRYNRMYGYHRENTVYNVHNISRVESETDMKCEINIDTSLS